MTDLPLVTIVTPSYNQGEYLEATILSVLDQDYPNIEYLVMDGGSDDQSVKIIESYADLLTYWESVPDRGQAHAINKGLRRARGEILGWLNSDDVLLSGTVRQTITAFLENSEIDVVYGRLGRIDAAGKAVPTPLLPKDQVIFDRHHAIGECVVNQPGSFWHRRIMERAGWLDERLKYVLDYEYWLRILLAGGKFLHLPYIVANFRLSPTSKTVGQTARMASEHLEVIEYYLSQPEISQRLGVSPQELDQQARQGRALISLYAFYGCFKERMWGEALVWLYRACRSDPRILLQKRWLDLATAHLRRKGFLL